MNDLGVLVSPSVIGFVIYVAVLALCYRVTLPAYLKFKRRKEGYGTVFDSYTGAPVDLARIRLIDVHGITVTSAVTDKSGHYRLVVAPGEYVVDVTRTGYTFPSFFLQEKKERSSTYDNVIPSRRIRIKDHGIVTKNIPIDPENPAFTRSKIFKRKMILSENAQFLTAWLSPFFAIAVPLKTPIQMPTLVFAWIAAAAYIAAMARRFLTFKPGRGTYGAVTDALSGVPLERVVVRLFDAVYNRQLQTLTTSEKGRYAFLVNAGSYYILMKKDGFKTVRLNFPNISQESYPLATDVRMKRSLATEGVSERESFF